MSPSDIEAALQSLAPELAQGGAEVTALRRMSGGASMETWAFRVLTPGGGSDLILRRRPDGSPSMEEGDRKVSLETEAVVIRAAAKQGAPVPPIVHVCVPEDGVGEAYVMGAVQGETLGRRIVRDEAFAAVRPRLARQCGEVLARIHSVPPEGLPDLAISDALIEIAKYEEIYRTSGAQRPIVEAALVHLKARAPKLARRTLVHGDFRNGNIMFDPEQGVAAVLDWELVHMGDPAEDMGWLCTNSWRFGEHRNPVGGFGQYEDLLAGYRDAGGEDIALERVLFWQMLGSLKWGIMCLIMYEIYRTGVDPSVERAMIGRRSSETEIDLVNLLERAS